MNHYPILDDIQEVGGFHATLSCDSEPQLLESLDDAFRTPVSVLSNGDFNGVKDQFMGGALSPVQFLDELQGLPKLQINMTGAIFLKM